MQMKNLHHGRMTQTTTTKKQGDVLEYSALPAFFLLDDDYVVFGVWEFAYETKKGFD